ncbi:Gfo/Idh/MocA family protein [Streptococcus ovuberis]|uniref:Gfo/Idh/MocA family oxidoreductase n=1 Tax=Streptococcus ovuberis TaxID=1936207 RepID=A0A7X6MXG2_9STRE|nr:Gfo/Idh/MocA family oxidoreductase [Streptococcus ovuberis]NKZ19538.1 Gfo/Idh/MocA family oxidoreductase [Streptococcus ovuberis]
MGDQFKWGFIGCGWIAEQMALEFEQSENHVIMAVWNRTTKRARTFTERFGGKVYEELDAFLKEPDIDGVYIAVTADKHAEYMRACISYGKPVLCEKPFTVNAKETEEVMVLAKEKRVYVSEAMWTWHNDVAKQVKTWIKRGRLGKVQAVEIAYSLPMIWTYPRPRLIERDLIGGAVMDIGVYALRYAYELFGLPKSLTCQGDLADTGVDLNEEICLDYGDFTAKLMIGINGSRGEHLLIFGEEGTLLVQDFHMAKQAEIYGRQRETYRAKHDLLLLRQADLVAEEIKRGQLQGDLTLDASLEVMELLDECRRQLGVVYPNEE